MTVMFNSYPTAVHANANGHSFPSNVVNPSSAPAPVKRISCGGGNRKGNSAERRATHNAVERARRESLNVRFLQLAKTIPSINEVRRPSKSLIVNTSIEFVAESVVREDLYRQKIENLILEADTLRSQLNELRGLQGLEALEAPERDTLPVRFVDAPKKGRRGSKSSEAAEDDNDMEGDGDFDNDNDYDTEVLAHVTSAGIVSGTAAAAPVVPPQRPHHQEYNIVNKSSTFPIFSSNTHDSHLPMHQLHNMFADATQPSSYTNLAHPTTTAGKFESSTYESLFTNTKSESSSAHNVNAYPGHFATDNIEARMQAQIAAALAWQRNQQDQQSQFLHHQQPHSVATSSASPSGTSSVGSVFVEGGATPALDQASTIASSIASLSPAIAFAHKLNGNANTALGSPAFTAGPTSPSSDFSSPPSSRTSLNLPNDLQANSALASLLHHLASAPNATPNNAMGLEKLLAVQQHLFAQQQQQQQQQQPLQRQYQQQQAQAFALPHSQAGLAPFTIASSTPLTAGLWNGVFNSAPVTASASPFSV